MIFFPIILQMYLKGSDIVDKIHIFFFFNSQTSKQISSRPSILRGTFNNICTTIVGF